MTAPCVSAGEKASVSFVPEPGHTYEFIVVVEAQPNPTPQVVLSKLLSFLRAETCELCTCVYIMQNHDIDHKSSFNTSQLIQILNWKVLEVVAKSILNTS